MRLLHSETGTRVARGRLTAGRAAWSGLVVAFLLLVPAARADEVEMLNGIHVQGQVVKEDKDSVTLRTEMGGAENEVKFDLAKVRAITIGGVRRLTSAGAAASERAASAPKAAVQLRPAADAPAAVGASGVAAQVEKAGTTTPPWWLRAESHWPKSLDLTWSDKSSDPMRSMSLYLRQEIFPNSDRWYDAVRMATHMLQVNKDNPDALTKTRALLGQLYYLMKDWARAAYWWQQAGVQGGDDVPYGVALCYARLGDKSLIQKAVGGVDRDTTPGFGLIRLCLDAGEIRTVQKLIDAELEGGQGGDAYVKAGERFAQAGANEAAFFCYEKTLNEPGSMRGDAARWAARRALVALVGRAWAADLRRIPDGSYKASERGYIGPVEVTVMVRDGRIVDVRVSAHKENRALTSIADIPRRIVQKQGVAGVDAVTGATITSDAIIIATGKALKSGEK